MKNWSLFAILPLILLACSKDDPNPVNNDPTPTQYEIVELKTDFGVMYIWLYDKTSLHKENFLKLAKDDFYDGTTFHRCITNFMIQGGDPNTKDSDPNNDGNGGPGYTIPAEILDEYKNVRGAFATARLGNTTNPQKASSGSQFFINLKHNTHLDGEYTVFGMVLSGMDAADKIVAQPTNSKDRPLTDIKMDVNIVKKTAAELKTEFDFTVPG